MTSPEEMESLVCPEVRMLTDWARTITKTLTCDVLTRKSNPVGTYLTNGCLRGSKSDRAIFVKLVATQSQMLTIDFGCINWFNDLPLQRASSPYINCIAFSAIRGVCSCKINKKTSELFFIILTSQ